MNEYDKVKIKASGITGIIVDIRHTKGTFYLVESDESGELIDCTEKELEKIKNAD